MEGGQSWGRSSGRGRRVEGRGNVSGPYTTWKRRASSVEEVNARRQWREVRELGKIEWKGKEGRGSRKRFRTYNMEKKRVGRHVEDLGWRGGRIVNEDSVSEPCNWTLGWRKGGICLHSRR